MLKLKKALSMLFAMSLIVSLLAACGGTEPSQNSSVAPSVSESSVAAATKEEEKQEETTLRFAWWGSDPRHEATLAAIDLYQSENPHIFIEGEYQGYDGYQQKLMTQMAGKTEPDLITLDYIWYPDLSAHQDVFVDFSQTDTVDLALYNSSTLEDFCSMDGKIIALPMGLNGFGTMINTSFYEKHGLAVDTAWTWEEMIAKGGEINAAHPEDYLFAIESGTSTGGLGPFVLNAYVYSKTGAYWTSDESKTIDASEETLTEAFAIIYELYESGAAQPLGEASLFTGQMEQNPKWLNGEMGFTVDWSGTINKYQEAVGEENFAVGLPPVAENGENKSVANKPSMVLAVSNNSKNVDAATTFASWLLSDEEAALLLGTQRSIPANSSALEALKGADAIDKEVSEMVKNADNDPAPPTPFIQGNSEVADIVKNICEEVAFGQLTPEAATQKFIAEVGAKLEQVA